MKSWSVALLVVVLGGGEAGAWSHAGAFGSASGGGGSWSASGYRGGSASGGGGSWSGSGFRGGSASGGDGSWNASGFRGGSASGGDGSWNATGFRGGSASGGGGSWHATGAYGATAWGGANYYGGRYTTYHPPTVVNHYGATCYDCGGWQTAGAAAVGGFIGARLAESREAELQTAQAPSAATPTYVVGAIYPSLPAGCQQSAKNPSDYDCNGTWFSAAFGANGVYYRVVPAPPS